MKLSDIHHAVLEIEPRAAEEPQIFNAYALCLYLAVAELPESLKEIEQAATEFLQVPGDQIAQMLGNLRAGGALTESGRFHGKLQEGLEGEDGGIIASVVVGIAEGRTKYDHDGFSLTAVGRQYVQEKLVPQILGSTK